MRRDGGNIIKGRGWRPKEEKYKKDEEDDSRGHIMQ